MSEDALSHFLTHPPVLAPQHQDTAYLSSRGYRTNNARSPLPRWASQGETFPGSHLPAFTGSKLMEPADALFLLMSFQLPVARVPGTWQTGHCPNLQASHDGFPALLPECWEK